jgi:hypothetical protein
MDTFDIVMLVMDTEDGIHAEDQESYAQACQEKQGYEGDSRRHLVQ